MIDTTLLRGCPAGSTIAPLRILAAACCLLSWGLCGRTAAAKTVADWQFRVPAGVALDAIPDAIGQVKFEGAASGVSVADGVLRVRHSVPDLDTSFAPLPAVPDGQPLWLIAEIAGWSFTGKPSEYVSFGFTEQREDGKLVLSPRETSEMILAEARLLRLRPDRANINGRAGGGGGASMGVAAGPGLPVPLEERKTTFIALLSDPATSTYAVLVKRENEEWRLAGRGATDARRRPRFVRLAFNSLTNDTEAEKVDLRRLSVTTTPPADLKPGVLPELPFITAPLWAVASAETGEILGGEGVDTPARMASINKTMTSFVVCDLAAKDPKVLDETITGTAASQATAGSTSGLPEGDALSVRDALYAFMLPSGNDIGVLLAEHFAPRLAPPETPLPASIPAARANFIAEMNRKAKALGMTSSTFRHPFSDGGTAADRTSTPRDLLLLAREAMKNPIFKKVVGTPHYRAIAKRPDGTTRTIEWENTNHLLGVNGINGIKTGTDPLAKACLLSSREADGHGYYAVVLGGEGYGRRFIDTMNIYEWIARRKGRPASFSAKKAQKAPATEAAEPESEDPR